MRVLLAASALSGALVAASLGSAAAPGAGSAPRIVQTSASTFVAIWDHTRLQSHVAMQFQMQLWRPDIATGTRVWNQTWIEGDLELVDRAETAIGGEPAFLSTWRSPDLPLADVDPDGPYEVRLRSRLATTDGTKSSAWLTATFTWPLDGGTPIVLRPPGKARAHH